MIERMTNGELLCLCQCGDISEPAPGNRVYAFHSSDNGETWSNKESVWPEDGQAVYCTELSVDGDVVTAYLCVHSGYFFDWKCQIVKSKDCGYTWEKAGEAPFFPEYTFFRRKIKTHDNRYLIPYQYYPMTKAEQERLQAEYGNTVIIHSARLPYYECGILEYDSNNANGHKYMAFQAAFPENSWVWSEPTLAELSDALLSC